ncbi:MAG: DNA recombination protein RmuC [Candidatus Binatia bacterium]
MNETILIAAVAAAAAVAAFLAWRAGSRTRELLVGRDSAIVLLQQQIEGMRAQVSQALEGNISLLQKQLGQAISQVNERLRENSDALQMSSRTLGERLDHASRVVGDVQKSLGGLGEATQRIFEVGKDIASLQEILRSPKLRGGIGELLLGELLAQILPPQHFELQHAFRSGERVDAVVRIGEGLVPIDAKFPLEDFRRSLEADGDAERTKARRGFVAQVKKHVDAIAAKYILPDEGTYDFALMYIPAENVFYETIVRAESGDDDGLNAYALGRRVIPVSPGSFYAYLQAILLGLRGLRVEDQAREILRQLGRLQGDLERFREDFRLVGKHLTNASSCFGSAEKRLEKLTERLATIDHAEAAPAVELPSPPEEESA